MFKPGNDVVHGLLDPCLGLPQMLAADARLLKVGIAVQQLLSRRKVVIQKSACLVLFLRFFLDHLEYLPGNALQTHNFCAELRVVNTVIGAADGLQHSLIALRLRLCGALRRLLLRSCRLSPPGSEKLVRRRLCAKQHVVAPVQIGLRPPHALLHHGLQIPLGLTFSYVGGLHKMGQRDSVPRSGAGQILGIASSPAVHDTAAGQQRNAACQQTCGIEQLPQEVPPLVVLNGEAQIIQYHIHQRRAAQHRQHGADDLHCLGAADGGTRRLGDHSDGAGLLVLPVRLFSGLLLMGLGADVRLGVRCRFFQLLRIVGKLIDQQEQSHRPCHQKHHADQQPRAQIIVL